MQLLEYVDKIKKQYNLSDKEIIAIFDFLEFTEEDIKDFYNEKLDINKVKEFVYILQLIENEIWININ